MTRFFGGDIATAAECFEACSATPACKQAVYARASSRCYPMSVADPTDQDGNGGTNDGFVSILCNAA